MEDKIKSGKETSENKIAWLMPLLNVLVLIGGALASAFSDSPVGMVAAAIVAALNSVVGSSYIKGRSAVKAAALLGAVIPK